MLGRDSVRVSRIMTPRMMITVGNDGVDDDDDDDNYVDYYDNDGAKTNQHSRDPVCQPVSQPILRKKLEAGSCSCFQLCFCRSRTVFKPI